MFFNYLSFRFFSFFYPDKNCLKNTTRLVENNFWRVKCIYSKMFFLLLLFVVRRYTNSIFAHSITLNREPNLFRLKCKTKTIYKPVYGKKYTYISRRKWKPLSGILFFNVLFRFRKKKKSSWRRIIIYIFFFPQTHRIT